MKLIFIENYIGEPLIHDYNLFKEDEKLTLINSIDGHFASQLIDTGNNIEWIHDKKHTLILNYNDAQKLLILLTEHNKTKIEFRETITLKTI